MLKLNKKHNFLKFSEIPLLFFQKIIFNVHNFNIFNIDNNPDLMNKIALYEKLLIERAEQTITMNILFDKPSLEHKKIRIYEDIAWHFYSQGLRTKYINSKNFYIAMPQLFNTDPYFNLPNYSNNNTSKLKNDSESNSNSNIDSEVEAIFSLNKNEKKIDSLLYNQSIEELNYEISYNVEDLIIDIEPQHAKNVSKDEKFIFSYSNYSDVNLQQYKKTVFGGSFDHSHIGHNLLLTTAALCAREGLLIGVTSDEMLSKKDNKIITQTFDLRCNNVRDTLNGVGFNKPIDIIKLNDTVGSTTTDKNLEAIIVTEETVKGAEFINKFRRENGINELDIIIARLVYYPDNNSYEIDNKISSTKIRVNIKKDAVYIEKLFTYWKYLSNKLNLNDELSMKWFSIIRDYYAQFWRKYHTFYHIFHFLETYSDLIEKFNLKENLEIIVSIWFHDIIYVPSRKDNEDVKFYLIKEVSNNFREIYK